MAAGQLGAFLRLLLGAERKGEERTDRQLLDLFVTRKDEAAFAALLERHGRLVFGVCQAVLGNEHDAEDAFQATFLVLARMAGSIRQRDALASWLYGVALRTALKARRAMNTRQRHEREAQPRTPTPPVAEAAGRELEAILCEEIGRLPEKYRAPLVLCCLQGKSRAEAAQELGWKEGTVSSRIANARSLLETNLTRRGVVVPAGLAATTLVPAVASAAVPVELAGGVIRAAVPFATGKAAETVSGGAIALAEGVLRTMLLTKLKMVSAALMLVLVLSGGGLLIHLAQSPPVREEIAPRSGAETRQEPPARVVNHPAGPPKRQVDAEVTLLRQLPAFRMDAGGQRHSLASDPYQPVIFSPDSSLMAFGMITQVEKVGYVRTLHVQAPDTGMELWTRQGDFSAAAFSPDQKILAVGHAQHIHLLNSSTGKLIRTLTIQKKPPLFQLEPPPSPREQLSGRGYLDLRALTFSLDGKTLAVISQEQGIFQLRATTLQRMQLTPQFDLFDVATGKHLRQTQGSGGAVYCLVGFFPDGKILAWEDMLQQRLDRLVNLNTGEVLFSLTHHDQHARIAGISPDGRKCIWGGTKYDDWHMRFWDLQQDRDAGRHRIKHGTLNGLVFSRDGDFFISLSADGIQQWSTATGQELLHFRGPVQQTECLALSPDDKLLATGGLDGTVFLWEISGGKFRGQLLRDRGWVRSVCFSPDGRFLVAGRDSTNARGQGQSEALIWRIPSDNE